MSKKEQNPAPPHLRIKTIILGEKYKDSISGYEGIATARIEYLYGCVRILLESKKLKNDGVPQEVYFDEQRLIPKNKKSKGHREPPGGPGPVPLRHTLPPNR